MIRLDSLINFPHRMVGLFLRHCHAIRRRGHLSQIHRFDYRYPTRASTGMVDTTNHFEPGQRVVVTQQIPQRHEVWTATVEGSVQRFEQKKTGSWFTHAKDKKLWLDRLTLRKDDGEIVVCVLDRYTRVQILGPAQPAAPSQADSPENRGDLADGGNQAGGRNRSRNDQDNERTETDPR